MPFELYRCSQESRSSPPPPLTSICLFISAKSLCFLLMCISCLRGWSRHTMKHSNGFAGRSGCWKEELNLLCQSLLSISKGVPVSEMLRAALTISTLPTLVPSHSTKGRKFNTGVQDSLFLILPKRNHRIVCVTYGNFGFTIWQMKF